MRAKERLKWEERELLQALEIKRVCQETRWYNINNSKQRLANESMFNKIWATYVRGKKWIVSWYGDWVHLHQAFLIINNNYVCCASPAKVKCPLGSLRRNFLLQILLVCWKCSKEIRFTLFTKAKIKLFT